jgi:hypothetical protein
MDLPSAPSTGFYNYGRSTRKHRMDLVLTFPGHTISGEGYDDVGQFVVTERFDGTNNECYSIKTYIGAHNTFTIAGFARAKGLGIMATAERIRWLSHLAIRARRRRQDQESAEEPAPVETVAA